MWPRTSIRQTAKERLQKACARETNLEKSLPGKTRYGAGCQLRATNERREARARRRKKAGKSHHKKARSQSLRDRTRQGYLAARMARKSEEKNDSEAEKTQVTRSLRPVVYMYGYSLQLSTFAYAVCNTECLCMYIYVRTLVHDLSEEAGTNGLAASRCLQATH